MQTELNSVCIFRSIIPTADKIRPMCSLFRIEYNHDDAIYAEISGYPPGTGEWLSRVADLPENVKGIVG